MRILGLILFGCLLGCGSMTQTSSPKSASGVKKATVKVETNSEGNTVEQQNVINRYKLENIPASVKHLYVISAMSGQVIIYSTVQGKVTSSSKRLTPTQVAAVDSKSYGESRRRGGVQVNIGGKTYFTPEVLQDDGTYGRSIPYLYWFDSKGVYHQHYLGNEILHISDQPLPVKSVIINLEGTDVTHHDLREDKE